LGAGWVASQHKLPWAEAYLHTEWHLDACRPFGHNRNGLKIEGLCSLFWDTLGEGYAPLGERELAEERGIPTVVAK